MGYTSSQDLTFRSTIRAWLEENSEILVLIRYSHAAGSKNFEFFHSIGSFLDRLRDLPPRTCLIVFRDTHLPLRGGVDDDFIERALSQVPDGTEYLITGLERVTYGQASWFPHWAGESHEEMKAELRDCHGQMVAVGVYPPWMYDGMAVISAVVPNPDGSVTTGVY